MESEITNKPEWSHLHPQIPGTDIICGSACDGYCDSEASIYESNPVIPQPVWEQHFVNPEWWMYVWKDAYGEGVHRIYSIVVPGECPLIKQPQRNYAKCFETGLVGIFTTLKAAQSLAENHSIVSLT